MSDDKVREKTPEEMQMLSDVAEASGRSISDLERLWRYPSFSIANISSSGSMNKTVIPRKVTADISMRIVPDQVSRIGTSHVVNSEAELGLIGFARDCRLIGALLRRSLLELEFFQRVQGGYHTFRQLVAYFPRKPLFQGIRECSE